MIDLPSLLVAVLMLVIIAVVQYWEARRRVRREAAARALARHPARRGQIVRQRRVPDDRGCTPLTEDELAQFTGIMLRSTTPREQGRPR